MYVEKSPADPLRRSRHWRQGHSLATADNTWNVVMRFAAFERDVATVNVSDPSRLHKWSSSFRCRSASGRRGMIDDFQKIDSVEGRMVDHLTTQLVATGIPSRAPPCTKVPTTRSPVRLITYCTVTRNVESTASTCTDSTRIHSLSQRCNELCTSICVVAASTTLLE